MKTPESLIAGEFFFDPEDLIYQDHFPGKPVVPGSLIIEAFIRAVRSVAQGGVTGLFVENFRFRHFISPGRYAFRVTGGFTGSMQCALYDGDRTVATGILSGDV